LICTLRNTGDNNPYAFEIYISGTSYEVLRYLVIIFWLPEITFKFPSERKTSRKPNKERPVDVPTLPNNRIAIEVLNLDGTIYQVYPSKSSVRKDLHIGVNTLERALVTGEVIRGYIFRYAKTFS